MEQDLESEGESDDFSRKVASSLGRPAEVFMGESAKDSKGDPNTSKPADGEEAMYETPAVTKQKADVSPPQAPKKGATRDKPLCSDDLPGIDDTYNVRIVAMDKAHQERLATMKELLTPLPPNASVADMEKRHVLLEEEMIKAGERARDLNIKETEFIRKQRQKEADDVFHPPHDKNLHK